MLFVTQFLRAQHKGEVLRKKYKLNGCVISALCCCILCGRIKDKNSAVSAIECQVCCIDLGIFSIVLLQRYL